MQTQLDAYRKAIETSPSHLVEQFVLLHSNYLDDAKHSPQAAYEKYSTKIAAIQALCATALAHKASAAKGGMHPGARHRKTKKKRRQNRWPVS